jgi:hypothetical protein
MREHILVHLFLQIDTDCAVGTNDLVGANARIGGHIAAGIWNAYIRRDITGGVLGPLHGRGEKSPQKILPGIRLG